jgi:RNA polymerase sigma-70 factor (ECF subfamily)
MAALVQRLVAVESAAFEEFALIFGPRFRRFFMRHGLGQTEAEDLAATCVTDIALKVAKYRPDEGSFTSWAFTLAHHAMVDSAKKARRESEASQELARESSHPSPREESLPDELAAEIDAVILELSPADQILLRRRTMDGEDSYGELAKELGINEGTARVRHLRVLRRLKERLMLVPTIRERLERRHP